MRNVLLAYHSDSIYIRGWIGIQTDFIPLNQIDLIMIVHSIE